MAASQQSCFKLNPDLRYDTGTIGGILGMKYWEDHFSTGYRNPKTHALSVTASQESEIVSILSAGTFFGGRSNLEDPYSLTDTDSTFQRADC